MGIKHLFLLSILSSLSFYVREVNAAATGCEGWIFLCEQESITVDDSLDKKPIRMPLNSSNCNNDGAVANCASTLEAKLGQKILVTSGIVFEVGPDRSPCGDSRHLMFSSESERVAKSDRKCGTMTAMSTLFQSVNEKLTMTYKSNFVSDGAVVHAEAFGCAKDSFVAPNPDTYLELVTSTFGPGDSQYGGLIKCREGYLMPGNLDTSTAMCRRSLTALQSGRSWKWDVPSVQQTCNKAMCDELMPPRNGRYELSNGRYHGSVAEFQCGEGYILEGDATQTCTVKSGPGATWGKTTPICRVVDCGVPLKIKNATYPPPAITTYLTVFQYSCDTGLHPRVAQATCMVSGEWQYTRCQAIVCPLPVTSPVWTKKSSRSPPAMWLLGDTLLYACVHDNTIASITCELSDDSNNSGAWTSLPTCRKIASLPPIERISKGPKANNQHHLVDKAAIVGGVIAGFIFAAIVIILACICIRRSSSKRKAARNNNDKEELKMVKTPLNSTDKPPKPKRLNHDDISQPMLPETDVERAARTSTPEYAAVVTHYKNRGTSRQQNGVNSNGTNGSNRTTVSNGTNGTVNSHKSSGSATASFGELIETGDLYDSVLNGGGAYDRNSTSQNSTSSEKKSFSDRQSFASDRKSVVSDRKSTSSDRRSTSSERKSTSSDKKSTSSDKRWRPDSSDEGSMKRAEYDLNESQVNGIMKPTIPNATIQFYGNPESLPV